MVSARPLERQHDERLRNDTFLRRMETQSKHNQVKQEICSQVVLVYIHPFSCKSLFCS